MRTTQHEERRVVPPRGQDTATQREIECDDCRWRGPLDDGVRPIPDLEVRIDAGQIVPAAECPRCGALAYLCEGTSHETDAAQTQRIEFVCAGKCIDTIATMDTSAHWDVEAQRWRPNEENVGEEPYCPECGANVEKRAIGESSSRRQ